MKKLISAYRRASAHAPKFTALAQLLSRLLLGTVFVGAGYGKLTHLEQTIEFFASIGVPAAGLQAPLVAISEFILGLFIFIGFGARIASLPLIFIMVVAIATTKGGDMENVFALLDMSEFLYIILLIWIVGTGAGKYSLDHLFCAKRKN